jgi:hypothetical protein
MTRKEELFAEYAKVKDKVSSVTLFVHMPTDETEIISNPRVLEKMAYVDKTYNDDLVHFNCDNIQIENYVFETQEETMDFGSAILNLKESHKVARKGWNGKGIFIELQVPDQYSKMTHPYIYIDTTGLETDNPDAPKDRVPWLASQTDMLAEDWIVVM